MPMSDWNRRLQEIGLVLFVFAIAIGFWFVFWLRENERKQGECIKITSEGEQVTRYGKRCKTLNVY